jgi:hypothetical protein
MEQSNP